MCSYFAANGVPSCANSWLLTDVLRKQWNRSDAYITTDCGVLKNNMGPPLNLKTKEESCAARASRIPSLCTRFTRAGIEWCRCHRAVFYGAATHGGPPLAPRGALTSPCGWK